MTRHGADINIYLDEILVADLQVLQSIPMSDVALVKIFDPPFFGGVRGGGNGAVAIYTKRGSSSNEEVRGLNSDFVIGYDHIKEFYIPEYDQNSALPDAADYRTTLYWHPFLLLDANNRRVSIPFYNNATGKRIKVIIEGLNELGQLTRTEKIFQ